MKQISFANNRTSSGRNARSLFMQNMWHRAVAICLLALVSAGMWADDYVFMQGSNYIFISGGSLTTTTTFSPSTCLWSGTSGGAFTNNGFTLKYSQNSPSGSDTFYYTTTLNSTGTDVPLVISADGTIQFTANVSATYHNILGATWWTDTPGTWYIQCNGSNVVASTTSSSTNNIKAYLVTTTDYPALTYIEGIEGNDAIGLTGTYNYTKIGSAIATTPACTKYTFNSTNYYKLSDNTITTTNPNPVSEEFTYTWSATCNDATYTGFSIDSTTGALTVTSLPTVDKTVTITLQATKTGYETQTVTKTVNISNRPPTGVTGGTVYLNDYEDHTWTYYAGVPADVDGGNYNTNYAGKIYSPDPRNVKITYQANGGAVSIDEDEDEFVYYKTIEKIGNAYKYQVISNPFSKRPTGKGFGGWEVVSGGSYIGKTNGAVLALDEELTLTGLDNNYTVNCTSAEIVLKATWVDANVTTITSNPTSNQTYSFTGGTYETNFIVLKNVNNTRTMTINSPCTIMMVEPDGSADYRSSYTFSGNITPNNTGVTKIENAKWNPSGNIDAKGRNFTIGRGMTMGGTARTLYGSNSNAVMNQVLIVESGTFSGYRGCANMSSHTKQIVVFGNDYDRAKNDNDKLSITGALYGLTTSSNLGLTDVSKELFHITTKSGKFYPTASVTDAAYNRSFYLFDYSQNNNGTRTLVIEGGEFGHIAGGANSTSNDATVNAVVNLKVRMKGGTVNGSIYGGAAQYNCSGSKQFVFTGGTVKGWIAGGSNGYSSGDEGSVTGASYVYIGGNAQINSNGDNTVRNAGVGGTVYGAGCGQSSTATSGRVALGTNVVVADNAYVERGVYGGGSFGYCPTDKMSNIYITGGEVGGGLGATNFVRVTSSGWGGETPEYSYNPSITGGVYGGACQNSGGAVNIYMTGGLVNGGLYGGSNVSGTINQNVSMVVTGGQVGTSTNNANIHGGGYGASTTVSQNVDVTLGTRNTTTGETAGTAVVYGDVYGGSALGNVNGTSATTTYKTNVTLNAGTIHGSLYGGALGNNSTAANVYGPVAVKVYGGSVLTTDGTGANGSGAVYGANNVNGAPQRAVTVDIYGTDEAPEEGEYALFAVYGGGNQAAYTYTETGKIYPQVTIHNCENSIEYVYGGGNQAAVPGTQVKVYGGNVIGNVFGGGNNADVTTNGTDVDIYGGTILNIFGGNNNGGSVTGNITVTVDAQAEGSGTACTMAVGNVYGGGNIASYTGSPVVDFLNGTSTGSIFGGGKGKEAVVVGNPTVNIGDWDDDHSAYIGGSVFGGGDLAAVEGNPIVVIRDCGTTICGDLYGGGNAAPVYNTNTTMWGGTVKGNVFGGGNGSDATKNPNGAQVGYKRDDATAGTGNGNAVTNIYGGTIGTWTTVSGVETCTAGGGVFGGSNTNGNIRGAVQFTMDEQACTETGAEQCDLKVKEAYGAGNEAAYKGTGITFALGCITSQNEIYGGAKAADLKGDVNLRITNGHFDKVFGGNNISGKLEGKIVVTVDETGCKPVTIGALYGGGNQAAYSVYGYDTDGSVNTSGSDPYADPVVNIVSCTRIDTIFGGGLGSTAVMVGNPKITVQQVAGKYDPDDDDASDGYSTNTGKLGAIGTIFGGGNEAEVKGTPEIRIATEDAILRADGTTSLSRKSANISGNVYGGGNKAKVTGNTKVVIGPQKATVTP